MNPLCLRAFVAIISGRDAAAEFKNPQEIQNFVV
jgi:hypothetical protein